MIEETSKIKTKIIITHIPDICCPINLLFKYFSKFGFIDCLYLPESQMGDLYAYLIMKKENDAAEILKSKFHNLDEDTRLVVYEHCSLSVGSSVLLRNWARTKDRREHKSSCLFGKLNEDSLRQILSYLPYLAAKVALERVCSCLLIGLRSIWASQGRLLLNRAALRDIELRPFPTLPFTDTQLSFLLQRFSESLTHLTVALNLNNTSSWPAPSSLKGNLKFPFELILTCCPDLTSFVYTQMSIRNSEIDRISSANLLSKSNLTSLTLVGVDMTDYTLHSLLSQLPGCIASLQMYIPIESLKFVSCLPSSLTKLQIEQFSSSENYLSIESIIHGISVSCPNLEEFSICYRNLTSYNSPVSPPTVAQTGNVFQRAVSVALYCEIFPASYFSNLQCLYLGSSFKGQPLRNFINHFKSLRLLHVHSDDEDFDLSEHTQLEEFQIKNYYAVGFYQNFKLPQSLKRFCTDLDINDEFTLDLFIHFPNLQHLDISNNSSLDEKMIQQIYKYRPRTFPLLKACIESTPLALRSTDKLGRVIDNLEFETTSSYNYECPSFLWHLIDGCVDRDDDDDEDYSELSSAIDNFIFLEQLGDMPSSDDYYEGSDDNYDSDVY